MPPPSYRITLKITIVKKIIREYLSLAKKMVMNGKNGGLCAFLYSLIDLFGKKRRDGILIDFVVTNEDIAGFCGISSRSSVNRMLNQLKKKTA